MAVIYDKEKYSVEISESKDGVSGYRFIQNDKKLENIFFVEKALYEADEKDVSIKITDSALQSVSFLLLNQVPPKGIKVELSNNNLLARGAFYLGNDCEVRIADNRGESYLSDNKYLIDDEGKFVFTNNNNVSLSIRKPFLEYTVPSFKLFSMTNSYSYKSYDFPAVWLNFTNSTKNNVVEVDGLEILATEIWAKNGVALRINSAKDGSKASIKDVQAESSIQIEAYERVEIENVKLADWTTLALYARGDANVFVSNYTAEHNATLHLSIKDSEYLIKDEESDNKIKLSNCFHKKDSRLIMETLSNNITVKDVDSLLAIASSTYNENSPCEARVVSSYDISIQRTSDIKLFGELNASSFFIEDAELVEVELNKREYTSVVNGSKGKISIEILGSKEVVFRADSDDFYGELHLKARNNASIIAHNVKTSKNDAAIHIVAEENERVEINNVEVDKYLYARGNVSVENTAVKDYSALRFSDSTVKNCNFKGTMGALCDANVENSTLADVTIDPSEFTPERKNNPTSLEGDNCDAEKINIEDSEILESKIYGYADIHSSIISNIYAIDSVSAESVAYFGDGRPVSGELVSKEASFNKASLMVESVKIDKSRELEL
jgi:hypothetical protein